MSSFPYALRQPSEYKFLTSILEDVNRDVIALNEDTRKLARSLAEEVLSEILERFKKDETFNQVYKGGVRFVGSYHEGLKISQPNRFEIYVVLEFPFPGECKVSRHSELGCVQVRVKERQNSSLGVPLRHSLDWTLKQIVNDQGFICPQKVLQWWQSLFAKFVDSAGRLVIDHRRLKWTTGGPAVTVSIEAGDYISPIDMVLVPVISFKNSDAYPPVEIYKSWILESSNPHQEWFIFPKRSHEASWNPQLQWALSFPDQEKFILKDKYHLKPGTRLLKRLRDKYTWGPVTSYIIKTVALHESHKGKEFYQNNLGFIFLRLLSRLRECVRDGDLRFYWDIQLNLMNEIKPETSFNISNCVERIWVKIHNLIDSGSRRELERYVKGLFLDIESNEVVPLEVSGRVPYRGSSGAGNYYNVQANQQEEESESFFQPKYLGAAAVGIGALLGAAYLYKKSDKK